MMTRVAYVAAAVAMMAGSAAAQTPTFSKDVAPILYRHCVQCHRTGEIGPMSLITYKEVRPWARAIRAKVLSREMPPWDADPSLLPLHNDPSLPAADIARIVAWADQGAPEGAAADLPPLPPLVEGWQIGTPDVVFEMPVTFEIPATGVLPWQSFFVPTRFAQDMWVTAAEIRVGDRARVHHAVVTIIAPGGNKPLGALEVRQLSQDAGRLDGALTPAEQVRLQTLATRAAGAEHRLVGYAAGEQPARFPGGLAKRIPAGAVLNFSLHYTTNGTTGHDRTRVGLILSKEPPTGEVFTGLINNGIFEIPPDADDVEVRSEALLREDVKIWALHPHMHVRGKDMTYTAIYPDGHEEVLLRVPRYRAEWQLDYVLATPKALPRGTRLLVTAHYDNSAANRRNPDPSATVRFGDQVWDEMMAGYFTFTLDRSARPTLSP